MPHLARALCRFNRHTPDRENVRWDGHDFVGHCQHCGQAITRVAKGKWRASQEAAKAL
jgi:hypothetical protein